MADRDERAAFEYWASDEGESPLAIERDGNDRYKLSAIQSYWDAWQARALLAQPAAVEPATVPKGWKLVPVEPTDEMRVPSYLSEINWPTRKQIYRDMISAAPSPAGAEPAHSDFCLDSVSKSKMDTLSALGMEMCGVVMIDGKGKRAVIDMGKVTWSDEHADSAAPSPDVAAERKVVANCYSNDDGETWCDFPDDIEFVHGLKVGDEYELSASVRYWTERFRVVKVPDDESDEYEVEQVNIAQPDAGEKA